MELSGLDGIGEHIQVQEECAGYVPWFGASSSCLALMASVVPQDGLIQNSSLASWCNHASSNNQYHYFPPSSNSSVDDQSFKMDCNRKYEEGPSANEQSVDPEKLPMQHFEQQIANGYSSSEDDQRESFGEDYSGDESDAVPENRSFEHEMIADPRWTRAARFEEPSHLLPAAKPNGAVQAKVLKRTMLDSTYREAKRDAIRTNCHVGYESSGVEGSGEGTSGSEAFSDSERFLQIVDSRSGAVININSIKPPILQRTMGRPTNVCEKSAAEVRIRSARFWKKRSRKQYSVLNGAVKQSRHCKKCRGNDHDVRRCPENNPLPPIGEENDLDDN